MLGWRHRLLASFPQHARHGRPAQARPDLAPELVDDDGFPVTSARSGEAVDEALQEEITEWLMLAGMAELQLGETH